jgi:O-antigen/teichoic acid export membrane protein
MTSATVTVAPSATVAARAARGRTVRDCVVVALSGQSGRILGLVGALALRNRLDPATLGLYSGLKLYLDQTNRSSLGIGQGASQEIPRLLAEGRDDEAQRVADVAHTYTALAVALYAAGLIAWAFLRRPLLAGDPLAPAWTWGLVVVAVLAPLQRAVTFRIAMLRARQAFGLPTTLDLAEGALGALVLLSGLALAGLPGMGLAVGGILAAKLIALRHGGRLRFDWRLDSTVALRLLRRGLPIFVCTALLGALASVDRVIVLWLIPDGTRAAGLYAVMLLATSWAPDLAGRVVTVLDPHFQATLGRSGGQAQPLGFEARRATELLAAVLGLGSAGALLIGPDLVGALLPAYREGLPALRPLLPGALAVALSWPSRQLLIATGQTRRLAWVTLAALSITLAAASIGALRGGLAGIAAGTSLGQSALLILASLAAVRPLLGVRAWTRHALTVVGLGILPLGLALALEQLIGPGGGWVNRLVQSGLLLGIAGAGIGAWTRALGLDLVRSLTARG